MRASRWLRGIRPAIIVLIGWGLVVLYAFPGIMTMDSFDQLREGRAWSFTDAHPPAMGALWGIIDRIVAGPIVMLLLQTGTFAAGLYLVLRRMITPTRAALVTCAILLFPPVFVPLAVIWKDCQMAGFMMLGLACLLDERPRVRVAGLALLAVATAMRYMALAATFPLVILLFEWRPAMPWFKRYAIAATAWIAITAVAMGVNSLLTQRELHLWHSTMAFQDIAGVLEFVDDEIPDSELAPLLEPTGIRVHANYHDAIRAKYVSYDFQDLVIGDGRLWDVDWTNPMPEARRDAVGHAWSTLIRAHPGAYARYRLENFGEVLGVNRRFAGATVVTHRGQYPGMLEYMGLAKGSWRIQDRAEQMNLWLAKRTRLFRPHVYALLALGVLLLALAIERRREVIAIVASGLCLELSMLPLTATPDYRYSHWLVVTSLLAAVLMFVARFRRGSVDLRT